MTGRNIRARRCSSRLPLPVESDQGAIHEVTSGPVAFTGVVCALVPTTVSATVYPYVDVPARYEYNPKTGTCTTTARRPPTRGDRADFRGPCANHDLCYMDHQRVKETRDRSLRTDLEMNGGVAFDQDGGHKDRDKFETCNRLAAAYYDWVRKKGRY